MQQKIMLMPQLRFPEFEGEWQFKTLGKIGEIVSGLTYSPNDINEDGVLVLRSSNVQNGNLVFDDNVYVKTNDYNKVIDNDILLVVRNGSKQLIGKCALITKEYEGLAFGAFMSIYRSKFNRFLIQWFWSEDFKRKVHKNLGATINSINGSNLKKFKVFMPYQIEEQQKIANFLSAVDKRIQTLEKKKNLLEQYKRGVMQKIFKQELRFKDDEGMSFPDWQKMSLSKFLIPTFRKVEKPKSNYLAIGVRSHCKGTFQKPETDPVSNSMTELFEVLPNDLIVNITFAWESAIAIVKDEDKGGLVSHRFPTYTFRDKLCLTDFFKYVIVNRKFRHQLDLISPGGAGRNRVLSKSEFLKIKWNLPCIKEQQKMASFLTAIDKKIELVTQQIEHTKTYKKGLLQQMFV